MPENKLSPAHQARFNRILLRAVLLPMAIMLVASVVLAALVSRLLTLSNWVDHTDKVIAEANACENLVFSMDASLQGFLVTGDDGLILQFKKSRDKLSSEFENLSRLVSDNPPQVQRLKSIRGMLDQWTNHAQEMRNRRESGADFRDFNLNAQGQELMDRIRDVFAKFTLQESELRKKRIDAVHGIAQAIQNSRLAVLLIMGLSLGLFFKQQLGKVVAIYQSALNTADQKSAALQLSENSLREAEIRLRQYADDLERTVAQRTAKLQEMVAELEAYSYSVSHDLRAPLRAMTGYARVLQEDCRQNLGPDGNCYLDRIINASSRMDRLIQDILSYSSISRSEIILQRVDLQQLVNDIVQQYPALNPADAGISIEGPLPNVLAQEASLGQSISNLLSNAVKFTRNGCPASVRIWAEPVGNNVRLWIEDKGIGISPEYQERIFSVFERIPCDSKYEGTGIGLAIVRRAVERMGGKVGVESELGKGSRFWLLLRGVASLSV